MLASMRNVAVILIVLSALSVHFVLLPNTSLGSGFEDTQLAHLLVSRHPPRVTSRIKKAGLPLVVRLVLWRRDALGTKLNGSAVHRVYVLNVYVDRSDPG